MVREISRKCTPRQIELYLNGINCLKKQFSLFIYFIYLFKIYLYSIFVVSSGFGLFFNDLDFFLGLLNNSEQKLNLIVYPLTAPTETLKIEFK
ncbi:hypothetical protein BpHYR1_016852 [Brachionus plicatilis]|uniref:Uncharacterized protein n=1 Tax=Brachionus plicatilis TaxID=10195 RepID=A0A3M7PSG0_BRAPC|nr:hypothetical protein BpHYR1_016852 [Brachionus plicatilis]